MKIFDPHDESFVAKNLRKDEWFLYQIDSESKIISKELIGIFDKGLVARISMFELAGLGLRIQLEVALPAVLIQCSDHMHWACLALCMLSHGRFYYDTGSAVFSKSPFDNEPMYGDNVEWIPMSDRLWDQAVMKKKIKITEKPVQQSLF